MTRDEVKQFIAALKRVRAEHASTREKACKFLMDSGYLDKNGEIAEPYRSAITKSSSDGR